MTRKPTNHEVKEAVRRLDDGEGADQYDLYETLDHTTADVAERVDRMLLSGDLWRDPTTKRLNLTEAGDTPPAPGHRGTTPARGAGSGEANTVAAIVRRLAADHVTVPQVPRSLIEARVGAARLDEAIAAGEVYESGVYIKVPHNWNSRREGVNSA